MAGLCCTVSFFGALEADLSEAFVAAVSPTACRPASAFGAGTAVCLEAAASGSRNCGLAVSTLVAAVFCDGLAPGARASGAS